MRGVTRDRWPGKGEKGKRKSDVLYSHPGKPVRIREQLDLAARITIFGGSLIIG